MNVFGRATSSIRVSPEQSPDVQLAHPRAESFARVSRGSSRWRVAPWLLLLACGCASQRSQEQPRLPFHVAVIPLTAESQRVIPAPAGKGHGEFVLALDSARVSNAVASNLAGSCFTSATLLPYPEGVTAEEFEQRSTAQRDAYWVKTAESAGADLLLECDLRYAPVVQSRSNEKFWTNLPLFLLGGPACYFVDDVSYHGEAQLSGQVFDLNAIRAEHATLEDGRAQLLHVESRFQEASLDFLDRAGGNVGLFAASILVPAGLLSHESRTAETKLADEVADDLARGLSRAVRDGSSDILVANRLTGFHLDSNYTLEVRGNLLHFRGEAVLRRGDLERMESYSLHLGPHTTSGEFGDGTPDPDLSTRRAHYVRYPFEADIPLDATADHLAIQLTAGGPNPGVRTFTMSLSGIWPSPLSSK